MEGQALRCKRRRGCTVKCVPAALADVREVEKRGGVRLLKGPVGSLL